MGENRSSDSSTSTLTRCIDSANKRKRECESDSFVRPLSMTTEGHPLLFRQLVNARLSPPPYQAFCNWESEKL
ncbi:hypothetical protein ACHQM5_030002 [Ranunculus cassubicifolius]